MSSNGASPVSGKNNNSNQNNNNNNNNKSNPSSQNSGFPQSPGSNNGQSAQQSNPQPSVDANGQAITGSAIPSFSTKDPNHYQNYRKLANEQSQFSKTMLQEGDYYNLIAQKVTLKLPTYDRLVGEALFARKAGKSIDDFKIAAAYPSMFGLGEYIWLPKPVISSGVTTWAVAGPFFFMPEVDANTGAIIGEQITVDSIIFDVSTLRTYMKRFSETDTVEGNEEFASLLSQASFNLDVASARTLMKLIENFHVSIWLDVLDKLNIFNLFKGTRVQSNKSIVLDNSDPKIKEVMTMILDGLSIQKGKGIDVLSMTKVASLMPLRIAKMKMQYKPPTLCAEAVYKLLKRWKFSEIFMYVGANNLLPNTITYRMCYGVWSIGYAVASQAETRPLKTWTMREVSSILKYALIGFQSTKYYEHKDEVDKMLKDQNKYGGSFSLAGAVDPEIKTVVLVLLQHLMKSDGNNPKKSNLKIAFKESGKINEDHEDDEEFLDEFLDASTNDEDSQIKMSEWFTKPKEKGASNDDDD